MFARNPTIPDARGDEDEAATGAEPDKEGHGEIILCADGAGGGKSATEVGIKRAGAGALQALLQNQFQRAIRARERSGAGIRTHHARAGVRLGALRAECAAAVGADGDGFDLVGGAFHAG